MKTPKIKLETVRVVKCLFAGCPRAALNRGLCHGHYMTAHRLVKANQVSWDVLVQVGKALPSAQGQRPMSHKDFFLNHNLKAA